jgi:hypothetical protein
VVKRIALLALVGGLAVASPASAATHTFKGKLATGGHVAFELKKNKRRIRKVIDWRWHDLPLRCENQSTHEHDGHFGKPWMRVDQKLQFGDERLNENPDFPNSASVAGGFPENWRHAEGTLQVVGKFTWGDCDSGVVSWAAKRR